MKSLKHIDFYFVDDDLLYLSYFRKQFSIDSPYSLFTFSSSDAFLKKFNRDQNNRNFKIVILDYVLSSDDKTARTGLDIIPVIKEIDSETEVIILSGYENMDVKATNSNVHPADFVKKNDHTFIRLSCSLNLILSSYNLKRKKKEGRNSIIIFLSILAIAILATVIIVVFWPELLS